MTSASIQTMTPLVVSEFVLHIHGAGRKGPELRKLQDACGDPVV